MSWTPETPSGAVGGRLVEFLVFNSQSKAKQAKQSKAKQAKQASKQSKVYKTKDTSKVAPS